MTMDIDRRTLMLGASLAAAAAPVTASARALGPVPKGRQPFLWGTAGAGHQIEGGNYASDNWVLENMKPSVFKEPSGDAVDSYHRFGEDIALVAALGFNTHRFSIEWSRIEPEQGQISLAGIAYYRRVLETIRKHGLTPFVSLTHYTVPRWFAARGGFTKRENIDAYVNYCTLITQRLGDLFDHCTTFNEPNLVAQLSWSATYPRIRGAFDAARRAAAKAMNSEDFAAYALCDWKVQQPIMIEAHNRAYAAIRRASNDRIEVGHTLSIPDDRAPASGPSGVERKLADYILPWLAVDGDFVGVQNYTYNLVGPDADLPYPEGVELTQMGYPLAPETLGNIVRLAARHTKKPLYVTEHGCAVTDDTRRVYMIDNALKGLYAAMRDGADVRGYIHWSLFDNYEWFYGYTPKFGLVAVDRQTFKRTPKPSARHLGAIAKAGLPKDLR